MARSNVDCGTLHTCGYVSYACHAAMHTCISCHVHMEDEPARCQMPRRGGGGNTFEHFRSHHIAMVRASEVLAYRVVVHMLPN
jgi:hypothetical protein